MNIGLNKVIRFLIGADFLLQSGWGLIGPIFAIFLTQQIKGANLTTVGFVAAFYWVTKSILQPFIAYSFDLKKGEKDDFKYLVIGLFMANLVPLGYIFATNISQIFLLEFVRGLAMAFAVPSWLAIFTRHIDSDWEAFTWSIHSTAIGLAAGFFAAFGGILATFLGFRAIFILVTLFGTCSSLLLLLIRDQMFPDGTPNQKMNSGADKKQI